MKALYALCLSLAAFAFARSAQAELKYLSYEVQSGTVKELTAEEVEKLDVTDKRWHETIRTTAEDGTQTTEMLFVQDTDISTEYYIGVFEVTQAQAHHLGLGQAVSNLGSAYGVEYSNTGFPFASTPTLNNKPGLAFPTPAQWLAYASTSEGKLATSDRKATNLRGGAIITSSSELVAWYNDKKWQAGANIHGVIDIFGNAAEYTCDLGEDGTPVVAFYGWPAESNNKYSWGKLQALTSPAATKLDADTIGGSITDIWGARLVYTVPAARTYTVTVTLDGDTVSTQEGLHMGDSVTAEPPTVAENRRLKEYTVTPEDLPVSGELGGTLSFKMPESDVTIAYTSEPYGTITVEKAEMQVNGGDWVTTAQVVVGDTVTLKADNPGQYQFFLQWDGNALQGTEDFPATAEDTIAVGEELMGVEATFAPVYLYYPRVIVVGGTATVAEEDAAKSFGNGYYAMGTVLTLEAQELPGYKFTEWTVDVAEKAGSLDAERGTYTIGTNAFSDAGTTVTLTASYEYDESGESGTVTPADIHLGSSLAEGVYTAHPLFGWTADSSEETVTDTTNNRYHVFPYVAAGLYANLDLTTGQVVYSDSLSQGETTGGSSMPSPPQQWQYDDLEAYLAAFEAWEKEWNEWAENHDSGTFNAKRLPLRRVIPTDGAAEFYLGVYETAMGHVENLNAFRKGDTPSSSNAAAYCGKNGGEAVLAGWPAAFNTLRNNLNDTFFGGAERVRYPTQNDLLRVAQTSVTTENPGAGEGYPTDKNLTEAMVVGGNTQSKPGNVNAMTPCYGFYGLWGNGWETDKDGNGFAGSAYFALDHGQKPFLTSKVVPLKEIPGQYSFATFRPAIDVEEAVVIYVGEESAATAVQVAPGQPLFADPSVVPTKALYRCTGWTLGETVIKAGENHTVTTADDGKVLVPTWEETPASVTVTCTNCLGPTTAYPGQTMTIYPPEGMAFAAEAPLAVTPEGSGITVGTPAEDGTLTVTFPETLPLDTKITLTGTLVPIEEPEPEMKPGYRFRLR